MGYEKASIMPVVFAAVATGFFCMITPGNATDLEDSVTQKDEGISAREITMEKRNASLAEIIGHICKVGNLHYAAGGPDEVLIAQKKVPLIPPDPVKEEDRETLRRKLRSLVIPAITFEEVELDDVLSYLQSKSKELDSAGEGVTFRMLSAYRTWTHKKGQSWEAKLLDLNESSITWETEKGRELEADINVLSEKDKKYLQRLRQVKSLKLGGKKYRNVRYKKTSEYGKAVVESDRGIHKLNSDKLPAEIRRRWCIEESTESETGDSSQGQDNDDAGFEMDNRFNKNMVGYEPTDKSDEEESKTLRFKDGSRLTYSSISVNKDKTRLKVMSQVGPKYPAWERIRVDSLPSEYVDKIRHYLWSLYREAERNVDAGDIRKATSLFQKVYKHRNFLGSEQRTELVQELKLSSGSKIKYFSLQLQKRRAEVEVISPQGRKSLSWDKLHIGSLPFEFIKKVRSGLISSYQKAEELYENREVEKAADLFLKVYKYREFLQKEHQDELKKAHIKEKAERKVHKDGEWVSWAKIQREKGLVNYNDKWVTPERRRELQIRETVRAKSHEEVKFRIVRALDTGSLCMSRDREPFILMGVGRKFVADNDRYVSDLYWAGTHTFKTKRGQPRTVNCYALKEKTAVNIRKADISSSGEKPHKAGESAKATNKKAAATGFFISKDGYMLTNYHIVKEVDRIVVHKNNDQFEAEVVSVDKKSDLALLKAEGEHKYLRFSPKRSLEEGATIFTAGFPMIQVQGRSMKVTKGIISSIRGINNEVRFYQIDAAVQPGNSGGPLLDKHGNVVGVVTAQLNDIAVLNVTGQVPENVNYAVKKTYIMGLLDSYQEFSDDDVTVGYEKNIEFKEAVEKAQKGVALIEVYD